jgi:hypothetical protein
MNTLTVGLIIAVGILGGFYAGARYGQGHPLPSSPVAATAQGGGTNFGGGAGGAGGGGGRGAAGAAGGGGGFVPAAVGQIVAVNGDTITVHDRTSNKDVKVNIGSARITKTGDGTPADLTQNVAVTVVGQTGGDGVVTAQTIAIGGAGGGRFGGGGQPSPAPTSQ